MAKKIFSICAALIAFAVAPVAASASPLLTEGGAAVAPGTEITATQDGNIVFTSSLGPLTCPKSPLYVKLSFNSGKLIEGNVENAIFANETGGDCTSSWAGEINYTVNNLPWCIKTTSTTDAFVLRGGGCSEVEKEVQITMDYTSGGFSCKYSRTSGISGTFNTNVTPTTLMFNTTEIVGASTNGGLCPNKWTLDAKYTLETSNGTGLSIG